MTPLPLSFLGPDLVLNAIFTAEMLLRVAAVGGVWPYLQEPWNIFDSVMVRTWPCTIAAPVDSEPVARAVGPALLHPPCIAPQLATTPPVDPCF
jgi:hypothetical protein